MIDDHFTIGELSQRSGRSTHTLRWYESQGLMPGVLRGRGKRRIYKRAHIGWLAFLARLKRSGMSVADMQTYASLVSQGGKSAKAREMFLVAHRERLDDEISNLQDARKTIEDKIDFYRKWQKTGKRPPEPDIPGLS